LNSVVDYLGSKGALIVTRERDSRAARRGLTFSAIEITSDGRKLHALMVQRRATPTTGLELFPIEIPAGEDYARKD
jgi:hypothetical protein